MEQVKTDLPFSYVTVKTTIGRIRKGILAVPVSLNHVFPDSKGKIYLVDSTGNVGAKSFTPASSSSNECRIGGLYAFYANHNVGDGDEIVVLKKDDDKFQLIPEKEFVGNVRQTLLSFQKSDEASKAEAELEAVSNYVDISKIDLLKNQFVTLSKNNIEKRKTRNIGAYKQNQPVPYSLRRILAELYKGKCQISNFTFTMKNGKRYFEIHHIDPNLGNHFKNLLVVSPNVHAQFTHASIKHAFDDQNWLRRVSFNGDERSVFQIIDVLQVDFEKQVHSVSSDID